MAQENFVLSHCAPDDVESMISGSFLRFLSFSHLLSPSDYLLSQNYFPKRNSNFAVYESAFANEYFSSFTFPNSTVTPTEKHRWLRARFLRTFSKPEIRNFKVVESSTGRMAAWARWGFPYSSGEEELKEEKEEGKGDFDKSEWPEGANIEVCEAKFGGLSKKRDGYIIKDETYGESISNLRWVRVRRE